MSVRRCDKLWSELVRRGGRCERCGSTDGLQAHHIISRSHYATRWDLDCGVALCVVCHGWAHAEPAAFRGWVEDTFGELLLVTLRERAGNVERARLLRRHTREVEGPLRTLLESW